MTDFLSWGILFAACGRRTSCLRKICPLADLHLPQPSEYRAHAPLTLYRGPTSITWNKLRSKVWYIYGAYQHARYFVLLFTEINTNTCQMHMSANFMPRRDICQSGDISITVRHNDLISSFFYCFADLRKSRSLVFSEWFKCRIRQYDEIPLCKRTLNQRYNFIIYIRIQTQRSYLLFREWVHDQRLVFFRYISDKPRRFDYEIAKKAAKRNVQITSM